MIFNFLMWFVFQDRRREIIAEYDEEIKLELADIKAAYEKKTHTEMNIRKKLEKEVEFCRLNHVQSKDKEGKRELNNDIKKLLDEKEAKILQLEKELIQVGKTKLVSYSNLKLLGPMYSVFCSCNA